jgi:hypothetical protein
VIVDIIDHHMKTHSAGQETGAIMEKLISLISRLDLAGLPS